MNRYKAGLVACLLLVAAAALGNNSANKGGGGMTGGQGSIPTSPGNTVGQSWFFNTGNPDDVPGMPDGAGGDPNPVFFDRSSHIAGAWNSTPFTNDVDYVHCLTSFNLGTEGCKARSNLNIYGSGMQVEYTYDGTARSGAEFNEWIWSVSPATHLINFSAGPVGMVMGDNVTFSNGAKCRPANISGANVRMTCEGGTPPAGTNTITVCTSGCTGTVNTATSETTGFRPWFYVWNTGTNSTSLDVQASPRNGTEWWFSGQYGASTLYVGWQGAGTNPMSVNLPGVANTFLSGAGAIATDTSAAGTTGGQLKFHDGTQVNVLQPTETACSWYDTNTTTANVQFRWASQVPITVTSIGCANLTASPAANPSITANTLSDSVPNAATHGQVDCVDLGVTLVYQAVTGANASFSAGEQMNFDIVQGTTATDDVMVCIQYRFTAQ